MCTWVNHKPQSTDRFPQPIASRMSSSDLSPPPDDGDGSSSDGSSGDGSSGTGSSGTGSSGDGARAHRSDDDLPDDLTAHGSHRAHQPPNDTGRTVRSPTGPDPA